MNDVLDIILTKNSLEAKCKKLRKKGLVVNYYPEVLYTLKKENNIKLLITITNINFLIRIDYINHVDFHLLSHFEYIRNFPNSVKTKEVKEAIKEDIKKFIHKTTSYEKDLNKIYYLFTGEHIKRKYKIQNILSNA